MSRPALLCAALLLAVAGCSSTQPRPDRRPTQTAPLLSAAGAHRLAAALGSGDPARVRAVLVLPAGQPLDDGFARDLAAQAPFDVDATTARPLDGDLVGVGATAGPPGGRRTWQLVLSGSPDHARLAFALPTTGLAAPRPVRVRGHARRCTSTGFGGSGRARPLVLVSGATGGPIRAARPHLARLLGGGWRVGTVELPAVRRAAPDDRRVVDCLARTVRTLSRAQRAAGGDGLVFVATHGTAGLSVRFAAARPGVGPLLGGVVSIATPAEGSPFGSPTYDGVDLRRLTTAPASVVSLPAVGSAAHGCLVFRGGCAAPPYLPLTAPLTQIGGDVTVARSWFGVHGYDLHVDGDGVVPIPSALGYHSSGPVGVRPPNAVSTASVRCTVGLESLASAPRASLVDGVAQATSGLNLMAAATRGGLTPGELQIVTRALVAPCSHGYLAVDPASLRLVAAAARDDAVTTHLIRDRS